jgi:F0F1-type ATP synthase delta subunit
MTDRTTTLEQKLGEKLVSEFAVRGRIDDILPVLSLISEVYGGTVLCDESLISSKHGTFARRFINIIERLNAPFNIADFTTFALNLHNVCVSSVDVHLVTDTPYSEELKNHIGDMCKEVCNARTYTLNEKVTQTHGGGFIARFKDYRLDASYTQGLHSL